jgi:hypothetical protein
MLRLRRDDLTVLPASLSMTKSRTCHAERSSEDRFAILTAESKHPYLHSDASTDRSNPIPNSNPTTKQITLHL